MTIQNKPTKEQLIKQLQELPLPHTRKNVRESIPDSHFIPVFGTFSAFKQCAGLGSTPLEKQFTSHVATHAISTSNSTLIKTNNELNSYANKYQRKDDKRFSTVMVCSDIHATMADSFSIDVFLDATTRVKPTHIVIAGDLWDFPHFSNYSHDPRKHSAVDELVWGHEFLTKLRELNPHAQITITQGNHDLRVFKHIVEQSPYVADVLDKFSHITPIKLLKLDELQINYVARTNLSVYKESEIKKEVAKNFIVIGDTLLVGHYPTLKKHGLPSVYGHHHRFITTSDYNLTYGSFYHIQLGCLCAIDASYTDDFDKWTQGFLITTVDSEKKRTINEYVDTTNDIAICGGKYYYRDNT
jgi:hypothetical protein